MSISNLSDDELRRELARREAIRRIARPQPLIPPNFEQVIKLVVDDVEQTVAGNDDEDREHYIYEAAIEAVYGKQIWDILRQYS